MYQKREGRDRSESEGDSLRLKKTGWRIVCPFPAIFKHIQVCNYMGALKLYPEKESSVHGIGYTEFVIKWASTEDY